MLLSEAIGGLSATTDPPVTLGVSGFGGVGVQITGTFVGTIQFEVSGDGLTFAALNMTPPNSTSAVTSATAVGQWQGSCVSKVVRCRMSAYTSGQAAVTMIAIPNGPGGGGSGGGGGGDATAANQVLQIADLDKMAAQVLDYDTGAGTASQVIYGIALPASGGPVAGGTATNPLNVITGLSVKIFDYIAYTPASTTDTYVYKTGGSGGTTQATVVVTWTDSTKTVLSTVVKT